ncbi:prepilin-type N-terminal cleavage/methylation domain-containing protein [Corallococcus macrosporus]|uniref:Type 4 pilus biogenesis operon protein n=1 Tax=Myxococcus fulvus (strain ATCC BAA-855 / HW-1) TaxID=483219 RepID=F8CA39_MYXFH|nr:prepilin-type N-terminal cleavage/methylation domain-containing protein [Corallococcus macrosporus]AEI63289.1 type 4 pilus biogenesis operon protein [Corallococcus macrosporus]
MRTPTRAARGFTLLEVMIASAIGLIVLGAGLVAAMQMQRRSQFEEQTMQAQTTGRVVMELLSADLQRAGAGMGNAPIVFSDTRIQAPLQVWTEPDLSAADVTRPFPADPGFALPPAGHLEEFASDVLQMHWGDTRAMVTLANCPGGFVRNGAQDFCLVPNSSTRLQPTAAPSTPALAVNPNRNRACHVRVTNVDAASNVLTAEVGSGLETTTVAPCGIAGDPLWRVQNPGQESWRIMQAQSVAYRVNWASGTPTLEYLGPGAADWVVLSRHVERLKVRFGVMSHAPPIGFRWFPDPDPAVDLPEIDNCTIARCPIDQHPTDEAAPPADDAELRLRLWQRVREAEVTLVVRTPRPDRDAFDPDEPIELDKEGFPIDGFKRRTYTFRVMLRNFAAGGMQPPLVGE